MITADEGEAQYELTNRDRKTEPCVTGPYWCQKCDRWLVREGEKCPGCGFRRKTKHRKP